MRLRSGDTLDGIARRTGIPRAAPIMARAIPVLPLVASRIALPGLSTSRFWASRTIEAAARSFTLPPGLVHSTLPSSVTPSRPRAICSRRTRGVDPMRSDSDMPNAVVVAVFSISSSPLRCGRVIGARCGPRCQCARLVGGKLRASPSIFSNRSAAMAQKTTKPTFDQALDILRAHSFEVTAYTGAANGTLAAKHGAAAVLVPGRDKDEPVAFAIHPGILVRGEVGRLLDRGYQKFIKTHQYELPATASELHAIHTFSEELTKLIGGESLYNQSLGTTSDLYEYDRLRGREEDEVPAPKRP